MNFVTLDFETATPDRNSPCEIGLTFVSEGKIVDSRSWLIKPIQFPNFDFFNISIHGIQPEDVADKPEFDVIWDSELKTLLEDQFIISHNASFDLSVLRRTLETYKIAFPSLRYTCSYIISKKIWEGLLSYDLKSICNHAEIPLTHHRAGNDSLACAELTLKAFEKAGINSFDDINQKLNISIGYLYDSGYRPSTSQQLHKPTEIFGDPSKFKPESIFYGRKVVFTGTLSSMVRKAAQQIIADIGGINSNTISNDTDFLVVGQQDFRVVGQDGMSGKQEKAQKLLQQGIAIEVISEDDFLRNT